MLDNIEDGLFRYLDTNGDGTGTKTVIADYSDVGAGATDFYIQSPSADIVYRISRLIVHIADATAPDAGGYGGNMSPLTNGIQVRVTDSSDVLVQDMLDGVAITTNAEWARVCYDSAPSEYGQGNNYVNVRWTFSKSGKSINLRDRYKLKVTVNDDFTFLTDHTFMVQGFRT